MSMTIKQAFEKLTANLSSSLRNPFFVGRTLHDTFADIAENIDAGGSSSAEDVSYDNTDSGLTADDVQAAIDEVVDLIPEIGYSTIEQNTGLKWIDGSDVYKCVVSGLNVSISTGWSEGFATSLNIKNIVDVKLFDATNPNNMLAIFISDVQVYNGGVRVSNNVSTTRTITEMIIEYTKAST